MLLAVARNVKTEKAIFDGSLTLKEFGMRYGQGMLDCIGAMHSSGMVGFM